MNRLFGRSKPSEPGPSINDSIANLNSKIDAGEKEITRLNVKLQSFKDQLKKKGNESSIQSIKAKASRILQQRKNYETRVDLLRQQVFNMEQADCATQTLKDTHITVAAMKDGVKQMQKAFKNINIDSIEDMQDDLADMLEQADDVQEALGRTYGMPEIDDDELAAELDALADDLATDTDTSYLDDAIKAPSAPDKEPGASSIRNKDGVLVDEFGLPQIPAS